MGKVHQILVKHLLLCLNVVSSKSPVHCMKMHPLLCHLFAEHFPQFTFCFGHDFWAILFLKLEEFPDHFVVWSFFLQRFIKLSAQIIENHSELFSVSLFATKFHQNIVNHFLQTSFYFLRDADFQRTKIMEFNVFLLETLHGANYEAWIVVENFVSFGFEFKIFVLFNLLRQHGDQCRKWHKLEIFIYTLTSVTELFLKLFVGKVSIFSFVQVQKVVNPIIKDSISDKWGDDQQISFRYRFRVIIRWGLDWFVIKRAPAANVNQLFAEKHFWDL